jgi:hypothetical protein
LICIKPAVGSLKIHVEVLSEVNFKTEFERQAESGG